ncbi:hypothetical protein C8Q76DRAFT_609079, partial [Earliella scabrosa]
MRLSPDHADTNDPEGNKADAAIFSKDVPVEKNRPNWSHQRLPTEFKLDGTNNDPFDDRLNHDTQSAADTRFKVFGQCAGYVNCVFRYQHRTAVFQLFVIGGGFRFLRWDRSAVFVSEKIDYLDDPRTLIDFLLGFVILDAESQGIDPTATLVQKGAPLYRLMDTTRASSSKDTGNTSTVFQRPKEGSFLLGHVLDYFSKSLKNWPRYRLVLRDQIFLVGKPIFESTGLVGRGTRGYVAWHVNSNSFVFLKDAWRPYYKTMEAEGETLLRLNAASVVNVPTLVCHGDVDEQTLNGRPMPKRKVDDLEMRDDELNPRLRHYAHYRICVKEICLPLKEFETSRQLVRIVRDCIDAHGAYAVEKCKVIHRDISSGNLLILPVVAQNPNSPGKFWVVWQGILIDWELSKPTPDAKGGDVAREPERTGTWSHMSVASLDDDMHVITNADEFESFFNVMLYNAIRY